MELLMTCTWTTGQLIRSTAIVFIGSCLALGTLTAQQAVMAGQRVRITRMPTTDTSASTEIDGSVVAVRDSSLVLLSHDREAELPFRDIARVEIAHGKNRRKGAAIGLLVGGLGGAAIGFASSTDCSSLAVGLCYSRVDNTLLGGVVGGLLGLAIGILAAPERWAPVSLRGKLAVMPMIAPRLTPTIGVQFALAW
jgi:hypothetical protein